MDYLEQSVKVAEMIFSGVLHLGQCELVKVAPSRKNGWTVEKANDQVKEEIPTVKFKKRDQKKKKVIIDAGHGRSGLAWVCV